MKVLITGANGQLGYDLQRTLSGKHEVFAFGRQELDVTDLDKAQRILSGIQPDAIIHSAAYTAVDAAESDVDNAYRVNAIGARNLALVAERTGAKVCYISTDYVFDGQSKVPYKEFDFPHPTTVYGKSKLAGEQYIQHLAKRHFVVRTSWLYGLQGKNFVKTMLTLGAKAQPLKVVQDQIGSPTYTADLAQFVMALIQTEKYGLYHASNSGCSWYDFAQAIFAESGLEVTVNPCSSNEFPRPAPRPSYSVLDNMSIRLNGFPSLRPWRDALREFLVELNDNGASP